MVLLKLSPKAMSESWGDVPDLHQRGPFQLSLSVSRCQDFPFTVVLAKLDPKIRHMVNIAKAYVTQAP